jgi:hypothetical protein
MAYLPGPYQPSWNTMSQYTAPQMTAEEPGLKWVDGEAAAKSYQLPAGLPPNKPVALWDTNDTVIYLKSVNAMGMPNPLQKIRYQMEELRPRYSGAAGREDYTEQAWDEEKLNKFASKEELRELKEEIEKLKAGAKE